jgi:transposase
MSPPKPTHLRRQYTKAFKQDAITLSDSIGVAAAADQLGLRRHLLYNWRSVLKQAGEKAFPGHGNATSLEAENAALRRALAEAQMERDILKKATAFFAKHLP